MKDIVITLPEELWNSICTGQKKIELRKSIPLLFDNYFNRCWVVQKGTSRVVGYFRIKVFGMYRDYQEHIETIAKDAAVSVPFVKSYYQGHKNAYIWFIGHVYQANRQYERFVLFGIKNNPQSYVYVDGPTHKLNVHQVQ